MKVSAHILKKTCFCPLIIFTNIYSFLKPRLHVMTRPYQISLLTNNFGDRSGTVVKVLCYKSEGRWFDPSWCHWIFHWRKILPIALWPWGWLSLEQKWVPGVFPGGKSGRCVKLTTYHHPVPLSRNLGTLTSWNTLGHSRPVTGLLYGAFPGGKGGRCVRLTILPPSCDVVTKSGSLNFLEPSGPLQTCNGTALLY